MASSFVARLTADETTAKRVAHVISETIDAAVASAFERVDGAWAAELHFSAPPDEEAVRALVASAAGDSAVDLQFATVAERDWVAASLEGLKPVRAGRFAVHGAHDRSRIAVNEIGIEIEAALAFGTGHHGTTRGCLLALDALAKKRKPRARHRDSQTILPNQILDLGTGSGVLAIAATRALRSPALATDIDPVAVAAARSNARSNRAGARVSVRRAAGTRGLHGRYTLIFANILLGPLLRMAAPLARLTAPGGVVVLSGLLPSHANAAIAAYRAQGLVLERRLLLDGWATLTLQRPRPKPPGPKAKRFA